MRDAVRAVFGLPLLLGLILLSSSASPAGADVSGGLLSSSASPAGTDLSGDVDCDHQITAVDSLHVLRKVAGLQPTAGCTSAGNVNCDSGIDAVDALLILRYVAGLGTELPEGCQPIGARVTRLEISFQVDPALQPGAGQIEGIDGGPPRTLVSISDELGNQADFVENEVLLQTGDPAVLQAFLDRWLGEILLTFRPEEFGLGGTEDIYLVRINMDLADRSGLEDDIAALDPSSRGDHRVSSDDALRLLAVAAGEAADGLVVGVNWVMYAEDLRERSTTEAPAGPGGFSSDAYDWNYMDRGSTQDVGVTEAWTALTKTNRLGNTSTIAILDGGFAPDTDFPTIVDSVGPFNVTNPLSCSGGSPCPWHGTNVLGAAMGIADNGFGAAGPGGPVANAITIHRSWDIFNAITGVARARSEGADIINMSWSARVPASLSWTVIPFEVATEIVFGSGALIFAAAGNSNQNVDATDCFIVCWEEAWHTPCENAGVICLGALASNSRSRASYSNYGSENVDIFAPGTVFVGPDLANPGNIAQSVSGTSFASPFTAGVAALIWAADPGLNNEEVRDILYETAHDSPDGRVRRYVNAWGAVLEALGGNTPPDIDIITPNNGQVFSRGSTLVSLSATATDPDGPVTISWTSSRDGALGSGSLVQTNRLSFGAHTITATATDSGGFSDFETVTITIVDDSPLVNITNPDEGAEYFQGQTINLTATSQDTNVVPPAPLPEADVSWIIDGATFGTGHSLVIPGGTLGVGNHTITFRGVERAMMGEGDLIASDSVTITINPNPPNLPPNVQITIPDDGDSFIQTGSDGTGPYADVNFTGIATDPEDGPLTGASLQWSYRKGTSGSFTVAGAGTTKTIRLYITDCFGTDYQVRLTATDGDGGSTSYTIDVTVYTLC